MPRAYPSLTPEQKREIITRIKEKGERVADLAKEYGVLPRTIYGFLSRSGQNSGALLELSNHIFQELGVSYRINQYNFYFF